MRVDFSAGGITPSLGATYGNDVVWLGAGYSTCATSGSLPLMGNFFDRLEEVSSPALHCFLREWFGNPRTANVEEVLLAIDQLRDAPVAAEKCRSALGPEVEVKARRELSSYILQRLGSFWLDRRQWASQFLSLCDETTTVVTTNYDNIGEVV